MRTILTFGLAFAIGLAATTNSSAQRILDRAINKAKEKLEQKAEEKAQEKIDEKIDEEIEKLEEKNKKEGQQEKKGETNEERSQRRIQGVLKGLGVSGEPVNFDDNYAFSTRIQMHLETIDKNGKKISEGDFITYMNPREANFAYEILSGEVGNKGTGIFILDFKNKSSLILSEEGGKKTGLAYGLNFLIDETASTQETIDQPENVEFTKLNPYLSKTGRTKKIQGYTCEEFHYNNPEEKQEAWYWVTRDLNIRTRDYFGSIFNAAAFSSGMGFGYLMESEAIDKKTGEKTKMSVTDLNTSANKKFNIKEYQVTNIGNINIPANQ